MAIKKATTKKSAKKVSPKIQAVRNANERCGLTTTFCTTMQVMFAFGEKRKYIVDGKVTQVGYDDCFIDELYDIVKAFATYMGFKTIDNYAKFIEERYEKIVYEKDEDGNMKAVAKKDEEYNKVVADNVRNIIRNYQVIVEGKE